MSQREQLRAVKALERVGRVSESQRKEYLASARGLGASILQQGLIQVVAFNSGQDGEPARATLIGHLREGLADAGFDVRGNTLEWLAQADVTTYRRASEEALAVAGWLKRVAEATLR